MYWAWIIRIFYCLGHRAKGHNSRQASKSQPVDFCIIVGKKELSLGLLGWQDLSRDITAKCLLWFQKNLPENAVNVEESRDKIDR